MPKDKQDDLTGAHNLEVIKAVKLIGQGLMLLADALAAPSAPVKSEPRPAAASSPETAPPPAEEPDEEEVEEIKLADLQKLAKDLIKAGGRPKLLEILEGLKLENVSSAPEDVWPELKEKLEEASE